jgi:DNA-binding Lrp family transcriptional regulator
MAEALGISERTIQRIITRLVDLGLVKRIAMIDRKTGAQLPNCYQLQSEIDWNHIVDSLAPNLVAMTEGVPVDLI